MATKRTYQPKKLHGQKVHGFRKRMATANGRKVLARPARQGPRPSVLLRNGPCGRHLNNVFRDGGNSVIPPSLVEFVSDVSNGRRQVAA